MTTKYVLQDWTKLKGDAADTVIQHQQFYADVSKAKKVIVEWEILKALNATTYIDTSLTADQKAWPDVATLTGTSGSVLLVREPGRTSGFLENFLRWRVVSSGAWEISFQIRLVIKG